jgi:hypothetical protein
MKLRTQKPMKIPPLIFNLPWYGTFKCRNCIQVRQFFLPLCEIYTHWRDYHPLKRERTVLLTDFWTVVLTDEPRANIRACGFASGGRYFTSFLRVIHG